MKEVGAKPKKYVENHRRKASQKQVKIKFTATRIEILGGTTPWGCRGPSRRNIDCLYDSGKWLLGGIDSI